MKIRVIWGTTQQYLSMFNSSSRLQDSDSFDDDGLFYEVECHTLIGVATIWLECLFENVPLDYAAPIISQQGEVNLSSNHLIARYSGSFRL